MKISWGSVFGLLVATVVIVTGITTALHPAETPVEITNTKPLLFLGNQNISPVIFLDGGIPKGVDVDIVRELARYISQPIEIRAMNWSQAQALVAQGEADVLIQINPTEERLKIYDFSDTLLESQFSIFTRSDTLGISGIESLRGLVVGVESKGLPQKILEKDPEILLTVIPNFPEGFIQLHEGELDAVVVDYLVGSYILAKNNFRNIKVTGEPIAYSHSSFAVKKGNTKLLNEINTALKAIKEDGSYQKVLDNWKPKEGIFQTQEQINEGLYQIVILILLLLIIIAVIWIATIKIDITKRKRAEEELHKNEEQLRILFEQAPDAILVYDADIDRFVNGNKNAQFLFGYELEELKKHGPAFFSHPSHTDNQSVQKEIADNLERVMNGENLFLNREIQRKNGEIRTCEVRLVKLPSAGKKLIRASYIDITERIKTEEELSQYRIHLEELVKKRTNELEIEKLHKEKTIKKLNLLSSITRHDIVNELQIIFGSLGLAREKNLDSKIKKYIEDAYLSSHNIERQIAFTRDYQEIGVHSPVWQDVSETIRHSVKTLDIGSIQLQIEISGIMIFADPLLEKVFFNLIDNAKRYGNKITTIRFYGFKHAEKYSIICEDDGVGIPDEFKSKIFTHEYFTHTGFGLNLSREILDITGITIVETGDAGKGAKFEIQVPEKNFKLMG
jgi:PAS domain S-box-containing protein